MVNYKQWNTVVFENWGKKRKGYSISRLHLGARASSIYRLYHPFPDLQVPRMIRAVLGQESWLSVSCPYVFLRFALQVHSCLRLLKQL